MYSSVSDAFLVQVDNKVPVGKKLRDLRRAGRIKFMASVVICGMWHSPRFLHRHLCSIRPASTIHKGPPGAVYVAPLKGDEKGPGSPQLRICFYSSLFIIF